MRQLMHGVSLTSSTGIPKPLVSKRQVSAKTPVTFYLGCVVLGCETYCGPHPLGIHTDQEF